MSDMGMLGAFLLACMAGCCGVAGITPGLRMPLLAGTSMISGMMIVGAVIAIAESSNDRVAYLGLAGVFLAAVAVVGVSVALGRMVATDTDRTDG